VDHLKVKFPSRNSPEEVKENHEIYQSGQPETQRNSNVSRDLPRNHTAQFLIRNELNFKYQSPRMLCRACLKKFSYEMVNFITQVYKRGMLRQ
jgi:hypothetical protein